jgi:eukaryotic-like serine/threonine-protein kinase
MPAVNAALPAPEPGHTDREVLALMAAALDQPDAERAAWVAAQTAGRPALQRKVEALLEADAALEAEESAALGRSPEHEPPARALPPAQIGPWRLEELIGAGGMGSVYRAERNDGLFQQTVAIKFMRLPGSLGAAPGAAPDLPMQALIDAERQSLARMEHPRIARILDAGVTDNGLPFLVMEFVHGDTIDRDVEARQLPLRERVALMRSVCAAVAHAHQNLVLHCDLKPANILVASDGRPKLIDFGVARMQDLAVTGLPEGLTRAYSSPERLAGERATPADDVFSLGVVMQQVLPPSSPEPGAGAARRRATGLPWDLQAVIDRAAAPARANRYPTVDALDDDLGRWLEGEPVIAAGGGWRYRLGKLARRYPKAVAASGLALVSLVVALSVISVLYGRAETERARAEARFAELRSFSQYVLFDLDRQLERVSGNTQARLGMVGRGQRYLESLAASAGGDDDLLREAAVGTARLAEVQGALGMPNVGDSAGSRANFERAEARLSALLERRPQDWILRRDLSRVQLRLADLLGIVGNDEAARLAKLQQAEVHLDRAIALAESTLPPVDIAARIDLHALLSTARASQSAAQDYLGQPVAAAERARDELARLGALPAELSSSVQIQERRGRAATQLGDSLFVAERFDASAEAYRQALEIFEAALAAQPGDRRLRQGMALAHWGATFTHLSLAQPARAAEQSARGLAIATDLAAADAEDQNLASLLSVLMTSHAQALALSGRRAEAIALMLGEVERREARARARPDDGDALRRHAVPLRSLSDMLWEHGDRTAACEMGLRAEAAWDALDRFSPLSALDRRNEARQREKDAGRCSR